MKIVRLVFVLFICLQAATTFGQSKDLRDFWFAIPLNIDPLEVTHKTLTLYVQAHQGGTVSVQVGPDSMAKTLAAGELWTLVLPKLAETTTSSEPMNRGVHVWSETSDLTVYHLSLNGAVSSEGFQVIPTSYWGSEYVVASYSSLIISSAFDFPSEFCIVASQDNTIVTIIPSQDIRQYASPTRSLHDKGVAFSDTLQRGESIQYKTVFNLSGSDLDLSGTVVSSNVPVGVIGASVCPFIPADPYCDHIAEMLLPVSRWGRTYRTVPFGDRSGGDSYRVIGTRAGQVIDRNGQQYAMLGKFESYFRDDIDNASEWTSADPFLLIKYINGRTYGGSNIGDPAMVEINPSEFARNSINVLVPVIASEAGHPAYTDYIHVFAPTIAATSLKFDGTPLLGTNGVTRIPLGSKGYEGIRMKNVAEGMHVITCDSPITAYVYGYSKDDSYAWSSDLGGAGDEVFSSVGRQSQQTEALRVWPNPARKGEMLHVPLPEVSHTKMTLRFIDALGKIALEATTQGDIDISPLGAGIYSLSLEDGGKRYGATLIVIE